MGQAKKRGTFEERRQRAEQSVAAKRAEIEAQWEVMPEEQKEKFRHRPHGVRMMDSVIIALAVAGAMMGGRRR